MNRFEIKRRKTEAQLLASALSLFVAKGYHGTSVQEITEKAGVTKGALYSHFKSKGELLLRVIQEFETRFIDEMMVVADQARGDAAEKLHTIVSFNSRFAMENPELCVFLTFMTNELKSDIEFEDQLKRIYGKYCDYIEGVVKQGQREGLFRPSLDARLAALTFMGLHDGTLHQYVLNRQEIDGAEYVRVFRRIFFQGLEEPPGPSGNQPRR